MDLGRVFFSSRTAVFDIMFAIEIYGFFRGVTGWLSKIFLEKKLLTPHLSYRKCENVKIMLKPFVFLFFFFAAFFVPAWPLLLLVALIYVVAWLMPKDSDSEGGNENETPVEPPPASPGGRWMNFTRASRRTTKPFRQKNSRIK